MNDFMALEISGAGMRAQRVRMQVVAENLANMQTTGPNGPYQRKETIFEAVPVAESFDQELEGALKAQPSLMAHSVAASEIRLDGSEPIKVYDPTHPHADAQGYVSRPNISMFREMTDMIEASRSYEANLSAAKTTQDMLTSALNLLPH